MTTDDEYPDSGEGEFAVGFGDAPIEVRIDATAAVNQSLSDARQALSDVQAGILSEIDETICACRNIFGECVDCATGSIDLLADQARQAAESIRARLLASIDQGIDIAGSQLISLFTELPGAAAVADVLPPAQSPSNSGSPVPDYSFLAQAGNAYRAILDSLREPGGSEDATDLPAPVIVPEALGDDLIGDLPPGGGSTAPGGGSTTGGSCTVCPTGWTLGTKLDPNTGSQIPWCFNPLGGPGKAPDCPTQPDECQDAGGFQVCLPSCDTATGTGGSGTGTGTGGTGPTLEVCAAGLTSCEANCETQGGTWNVTEDGISGTCEPGNTGGLRQGFSCNLPPGTPPTCFTDRAAADAFIEENGGPDGPWIITTSGSHVIGPGGGKFPITPDCGADKGCADCPPKDLAGAQFIAPPALTPEQRIYVCDPANWNTYADAVTTTSEFNEAIQKNMANAVFEIGRDIYKSGSSGSIIGRSLLWLITFLVAPAVSFIGLLSDNWVRLFPFVTGCNDEKNEHVRRKANFAMSIMSWLGVRDRAVAKSLEYEQNFFCQTELPSVSEINSARRVGVLSEDEWKFGLKLNGACLPWYEKVYDLSKPLVPVSVAIGYGRAGLEPEDANNDRLKRYGLLTETDRQDFIYATEQLPSPSDLVRYMTRDAGDEETVELFGYDDEFETKYTDKIKEWAARSNIPEERMKYEWRSHWKIPSNSELYAMLHRLRPEKNLVDDEGRPLAVEYEQVLQALQINDVAPRFAQRLVELSYRVPGVRQIAKAYETGAIDLEQAKGLYQDNGYDKDNAEILINYMRVDSAERRAKAQGLITPSEMEKAFREGAVGRDQFVQALTDANIPMDVAVNRVNAAELRNQIADIKVRITNIRRSYLRGAIDSQQYLNKLITAGVDQPRATAIVDRDRDVLASKNKAVSLAQNCKLVGQGYLSLAEYRQRALNLGYTELDALYLASSCNADHQEKLQKTLAADQRRAVQEAEKAAAKAEKNRRAQRRLYLESLPCKPKGKPSCAGPVSIPSEIAGMTVG